MPRNAVLGRPGPSLAGEHVEVCSPPGAWVGCAVRLGGRALVVGWASRTVPVAVSGRGRWRVTEEVVSSQQSS